MKPEFRGCLLALPKKLFLKALAKNLFLKCQQEISNPKSNSGKPRIWIMSFLALLQNDFQRSIFFKKFFYLNGCMGAVGPAQAQCGCPHSNKIFFEEDLPLKIMLQKFKEFILSRADGSL